MTDLQVAKLPTFNLGINLFLMPFFKNKLKIAPRILNKVFPGSRFGKGIRNAQRLEHTRCILVGMLSSVLQCLVVCRSMLQCDAVKWNTTTILTLQTDYGVATISRIDKMIGLFCKRAL